MGKEGDLIRELRSNSKPIFYPCTVFRQPRPLPQCVLSCRRPAADCFVDYRTGGVTGVLLSSHQVDCARKNRQLGDLNVLIKSLVCGQTVNHPYLAQTWHGRTHKYSCISRCKVWQPKSFYPMFELRTFHPSLLKKWEKIERKKNELS